MDYLRFRPRFAELIEAERMYTIEQLDSEILQGHRQLWSAGDSAIVTGIVQHDGAAKIGQVDWAVGNLDEILTEIMPRAEAFLKDSGCAKIMFEGRLGWKRVLQCHGFRPHSITLTKDLA